MLAIGLDQAIFLRLQRCDYFLALGLLRLQRLLQYLREPFKDGGSLSLHSPLVEKAALGPDSTLLVRLQEPHANVALQLEVDHMRPVGLAVPLGQGVSFELVESSLSETHLTELV